jgi:hypothetical protein
MTHKLLVNLIHMGRPNHRARLVKVQSLETGGNCARNPGQRMPMRDQLYDLVAS